ncbi:hypothetical protein PHYPSEUDO_008033 [Phytophthora pseudosyringae]|uniref:Uncharacterized protein n=1 Tax=Phytophthora pseudosyringae TaxID=221518 RepID=A0A8T1VFC8_9STRA|nr:hypothetical protein PHYPSEUDO_008033 [Phytophthora pseudosyringae]
MKRPTAASTTPRKATSDSPHGSESDLEDKPPAPPAKKARKAPAKAKPVKAVSSAKRAPAVTRADSEFNLSSFMESFEGRTALAESAPSEELPAVAATPSLSSSDVRDEVQVLKAEVARLRAVVAGQAIVQGPSHDAVRRVDAPSRRRETLRAKKAKGDYSPPQAHLLAATRMFRSFGTETGKPLSAMSFVLAMRELESAKFRMTPAVLMAIFSGRLGSRGLTVLHFKESSELATLEDGSSNVNFSSDFSPSASLPSASTDCATYEDIIDALHGLSAFGQDLWYDHMRKLTSRLRNFVAKNKSADPDNTRARVRLTLLYVNKFMGTALGFMQLDDPQWWNGFSEALRAVDYQSPMWMMALVGAMSLTKRPQTLVRRAAM